MRTRELTRHALNWAVAKCEGKSPSLFIYKQTGALAKEHDYSTDWSLGGPIIEREKISITINDSGVWIASMDYNYSDYPLYMQAGETALVAAMRSYVASKLGDEVDIPEELL